MSKQTERRTAEFQAVRDAIQNGTKRKDALAAAGVTSGGYWQWCRRNGLGKNDVSKVTPTSAQFKAAEREVRLRLSTPEICEKHGITTAQLYAWRHETGSLPK